MSLQISELCSGPAGEGLPVLHRAAGDGYGAIRHRLDRGPERLSARVTRHLGICAPKFAALHKERRGGTAGQHHTKGNKSHARHDHDFGRPRPVMQDC